MGISCMAACTLSAMAPSTSAVAAATEPSNAVMSTNAPKLAFKPVSQYLCRRATRPHGREVLAHHRNHALPPQDRRSTHVIKYMNVDCTTSTGNSTTVLLSM